MANSTLLVLDLEFNISISIWHLYRLTICYFHAIAKASTLAAIFKQYVSLKK